MSMERRERRKGGRIEVIFFYFSEERRGPSSGKKGKEKKAHCMRLMLRLGREREMTHSSTERP